MFLSYRYFLEFEASRGYNGKGDVAIDDFSLSPECFGIGNSFSASSSIAPSTRFLLSSYYHRLTVAGVPQDVLGDFNYYSPVIGSERPSEQHVDFVNETGNENRLNHFTIPDRGLLIFFQILIFKIFLL